MNTKLHRVGSLLLCMVLLLCILSASISMAASAEENSAELERATAYGISLGDIALDAPLTWQQFCGMLATTLAKADGEASERFVQDADTGVTRTEIMNRDAAMLACFYASTEVGLLSNYGEGFELYQTLGDAAYDEMAWDYGDAFPAWHEPAYANDNPWDDHLTASYFYNLSYRSPLSERRMFEYDETANSLHLNQPITGKDGVCAIVRLMDGIMEIPEYAARSLQAATMQEREAFATLVAERKAEILNSPSDYPTDGTVYYVSNNGDDSNDGLSPETAWLTLDKVNSGAWTWEGQLNSEQFPEFLWASKHPKERVTLKSSDTVLFERGGLWRGRLQTVEGVTYSAYGQGDKPCFYGSPENGSGAEKWTLVEGTTNIWLFHQPVQQCGLIVCNNDTIALRDYAYYENGVYYKMASNATLSWDAMAQLPVLTPQGISENLHFFCEIPFVNSGEYWIAGALYLRCDEGNPGEVFSSMEFATGNNGWNEGMARVLSNVTLDNLCFRYGMSGIYVHDSENAVIRNCEVSYVGGMIISAGGGSDISDRPEECSLTCSGDAILLGGVNNVAENNYISNTFDYGVTVEAFSGDPESPYRSGCRVSGNMLETCYGGLLVVDWNAIINKKNAPVFTDITLSDNITAYSGCNKWAHYDQRFDENWNFVEDGYGNSELSLWINPGCKDIHVENNVFGFGYENEYRVSLTYVDSDLSWLTAAGNTYLAEYGAKFISVNNYGIGTNEDQYLRFDVDRNLKQHIQEQLKDESCKLTLIE